MLITHTTRVRYHKPLSEKSDNVTTMAFVSMSRLSEVQKKAQLALNSSFPPQTDTYYEILTLLALHAIE